MKPISYKTSLIIAICLSASWTNNGIARGSFTNPYESMINTTQSIKKTASVQNMPKTYEGKFLDNIKALEQDIKLAIPLYADWAGISFAKQELDEASLVLLVFAAHLAETKAFYHLSKEVRQSILEKLKPILATLKVNSENALVSDAEFTIKALENSLNDSTYRKPWNGSVKEMRDRRN